MPTISLNTASALTGIAKRTLWRYIQDGRLKTACDLSDTKTHVELSDALALNATQLTPEQIGLALAADSGDAIAQCELALWLLDCQRLTLARDWFAQSARSGYPDAMCWLARTYLSGEGVELNLETGVQWLDKAAHKGHPLGQALYQFLHSSAGQELLHAQNPIALNQTLDDLERQVILNTLNETADVS